MIWNLQELIQNRAHEAATDFFGVNLLKLWLALRLLDG